MGKSLKYIFGMLLLFCMATVAAQDVKIEVRSPLIVSKGDQFQIQFVVSSSKNDLDGSQFTTPEISGVVNVLSGPVKSIGVFGSFSSSGSSSAQITNTYTYWVQATELGKITVSPAKVTVEGKNYSTKSTTIEVAAATRQPAAGGGRRNESATSRQETQRPTLAADDVLLRMEVNKREVYKGEPIVASLKLYNRITSQLSAAKAPAMNGFWAQQLPSTQTIRREVYGGKPYETQIISQWLLYPQRTGTVEIEQMEMSGHAKIEVGPELTGDPLADMAFGSRRQENIPLKVVSPAVQIQVKELPEPFPESFAGAVGKFELDGVISGDRFPANTAGTVTIRLSGTGSFPLIEVPKIEFPAGFEEYSAKTNDRLTQTARGTSGERTYEYPFIARAEGTYTIPGIKFSYFDPDTKRYHTLNTGDFKVEVLRDESGGEGTAGLGMVSGVTKEDLKMLGQDIRFIRIGAPGLAKTTKGVFLWSPGWFFAVVLLFLLFGGVLYLMEKRIRERADLTKVKTKKANKVALRRLKIAKVYMTTMKESEFFEEMLKALWGYMGDKLAIDVANLTKDNVRSELEMRGVEEEQVDDFLSLISECELSQYSPEVGIRMDKAYAAALDLIEQFESKI